MLAKVFSAAVIGLEGVLVDVEVDISLGLPTFTIVGLPDTAVQEAKERVRAAINPLHAFLLSTEYAQSFPSAAHGMLTNLP